MPEDILAMAKALINAVEKALACGLEHYDRNGKRLVTTEEVLRAMKEGPITLKEPNEHHLN